VNSSPQISATDLESLIPMLRLHGSRLELDKLQLFIVRRLLSAASGDDRLPDELVGTVSTLSDAAGWLNQRKVGLDDVTKLVGGAGESEFEAHRLETRLASLRPIEPSDHLLLYRSAMHPQSSYRWRYRGTSISLTQFVDGLFSGSLAQFAVTGSEGELLGLVAAYNPRHDNGTCYIALERAAPSSDRSSSAMIDGLFLFIEYLFRTWNFRKLHADIPGFNYRYFESGEGVFFEVEGTLEENDFFDGRYWPLRVITIWRHSWEQRAPLLRQIASASRG
jgi:RimJ/RimL family protein N-acetyltransferase